MHSLLNISHLKSAFSLSALGCLPSPCGDTPTFPRMEKAGKKKHGSGAPSSERITHGHLGLHTCLWLYGAGDSADVLGSHSLWPAAVPQCTMNEAFVSVSLLRDSTPCSVSKNTSGSSKPLGGLVNRPLTCTRHECQCLDGSFQNSVLLLYKGMLVKTFLRMCYTQNCMCPRTAMSAAQHKH